MAVEKHPEEAPMMVPPQQLVVQASEHQHEPEKVVLTLNFGKRTGALVARRIKGGVGVFCRRKRGRDDLIHRFYIDGPANLEIKEEVPVPHGEEVLVAYFAKSDGRLVIELLHVAILVEAYLPSGTVFRVDSVWTAHQ